MGETVGFGDAEGLRAFLSEHPKTAVGVVIYRGNEIMALGENIVALPHSLILGMQVHPTKRRADMERVRENVEWRNSKEFQDEATKKRVAATRATNEAKKKN
ncbi:MAG: hypothetical protein HY741_03640 [Chloroflexi bacterium]|nr:hypothetical protein [Chloroflexota bacterium]